MNLERKKFKDVDLENSFFDSLKSDYKEFPIWFVKKHDDFAYIFYSDNQIIDGFLYLKIEDNELLDINPTFPAARRLKVGTMKINAHGTKLGERFIKKIFDHAIYENVEEIYVTVFSDHASLISLFKKYGFIHKADKTTQNGTELVLVKLFKDQYLNVVNNYPLVNLTTNNIYLLSLKPEWHTRLLPDSILNTENSDIVQDISHTNSIHKVYLTAMRNIDNLKQGDVLLVYRTSDEAGRAFYKSVSTSICVVEEYKNIQEFLSMEEFLKYCRPYSVFTEDELKNFWNRKKYPHIIRFTYNIALKKRVTRGDMINDFGLNGNDYWGFLKLSKEQFINIIRKGLVDENLIIH